MWWWKRAAGGASSRRAEDDWQKIGTDGSLVTVWRMVCWVRVRAEGNAMKILGEDSEDAKGWSRVLAVNVKSPRGEQQERGKAPG